VSQKGKAQHLSNKRQGSNNVVARKGTLEGRWTVSGNILADTDAVEGRPLVRKTDKPRKGGFSETRWRSSSSAAVERPPRRKGSKALDAMPPSKRVGEKSKKASQKTKKKKKRESKENRVT